MSQIVFQKDWFAVFKVKVTVKDHVTKHDFLISSLIYALTVRVIGAPQMISQPVTPIFLALLCPLGLGELQACPFPDVVFRPLPLSALSCSPFHCALQDCFGQT